MLEVIRRELINSSEAGYDDFKYNICWIILSYTWYKRREEKVIKRVEVGEREGGGKDEDSGRETKRENGS